MVRPQSNTLNSLLSSTFNFSSSIYRGMGIFEPMPNDHDHPTNFSSVVADLITGFIAGLPMGRPEHP